MRLSPQDVPAHRVVRADGVLVGPSANVRKAALVDEGVVFKVQLWYTLLGTKLAFVIFT